MFFLFFFLSFMSFFSFACTIQNFFDFFWQIIFGEITVYHPKLYPKYTLHSKLFGCTVCTLNYDVCYTLHPSVCFTVKFDGNMKHVTFTCDLFKWDKYKRPKNPSSQSIKNIFFPSLSQHNRRFIKNIKICRLQSTQGFWIWTFMGNYTLFTCCSGWRLL